MASTPPSGSGTDQVELASATVQPPPAQTELERQEEMRMRIELISGLEGILNTSVLQSLNLSVKNMKHMRFCCLF